jgi:hydrogenase-4 membrane subunit HyfE
MLRVSKQFLLWVPFVIAYSVTFHQVFLWIPFALLCARLMNATHKITADHLLEIDIIQHHYSE